MSEFKLPNDFLIKYSELEKELIYLKYIKKSIKIRTLYDSNIQLFPIGIILISIDGYVGWSLCNYKAKDKWNKIIGLMIAVGRLKRKINIKKFDDWITAQTIGERNKYKTQMNLLYQEWRSIKSFLGKEKECLYGRK